MKTNSDKRINLPCALCVAKNIHRYSQHLVMGLIWIKLPVKFLQFRTSSKCSQCCGLLLCNCSLLLCNTLLSPLVEDHQGIVWPHELPSFHDLCDVGLPCPSVWSLSLSEVMSLAQKRLVSLDSRIFGRGTCECETEVSSFEIISTQHDWYYFLGLFQDHWQPVSWHYNFKGNKITMISLCKKSHLYSWYHKRVLWYHTSWSITIPSILW